MDGLEVRPAVMESMEELDPTVGGPPTRPSLLWVAKVEPLPKSTIVVAAVISSLGRWMGGEGGSLSSNDDGL